jgi:hypothetical protein
LRWLALALGLVACRKASAPTPPPPVVDVSGADAAASDASLASTPPRFVDYSGPGYSLRVPEGWDASATEHSLALTRGSSRIDLFLEPGAGSDPKVFMDRVLAGLAPRYHGFEVVQRQAASPTTEAAFVSFEDQGPRVGIVIAGTPAGGLAALYAAPPAGLDSRTAAAILREMMTSLTQKAATPSVP